MKKFKGGLYADLGNYKTSLPNTEILNNFFASNPVGYRSGGIVRGVAGGNPTGMKVTGGFLANARKYQFGGSSYYNPSELVAKNIASKTRPGNFRAQANKRKIDIRKKIDDFRNTDEGYYARYLSDPTVIEQLSKDLNIPINDIQNAFTTISEPLEKYKVKKGTKGKKGQSLEDFPDIPYDIKTKKLVPTGLEEQEKDFLSDKENVAYMSKKKPVPKKPFVSQNPDYVKDMLSQGITGVGDFDIDQFNKMKKEGEMKKNQIDLDEIESLNENEQKIIKNANSGKSNIVDTIKQNQMIPIQKQKIQLKIYKTILKKL